MTSEVPVKPWRASATALEMYSACPQAWSFKYELGIEAPKTRPLLLGTLIAMSLEAYIQHCADANLATDVSAAAEITRQTYTNKGQGIPYDCLEEALGIVEKFARAHMLDFDHLVGVEVWLPLDMAGPLMLAGKELVGKTDELYMSDDGTVATIKDAKSNWQIPSEDKVRNLMQSRVYPLLVLHSFPDVEEVHVLYQYARHDAEREVVWTRFEIEEERPRLEALVAQMARGGKRPATPGDWCGWCEYIARCPAFQTAATTKVFPVPTTQEEAAAMAARGILLDAARKRQNELLQVYARANGPIAVNGVSTGYFQSETPTVEPRAFDAYCRENDLDPLDYMNVPTPELRKLLRKRADLALIVRPKIETRWGSRKADEQGAEDVA